MVGRDNILLKCEAVCRAVLPASGAAWRCTTHDMKVFSVRL